MPDPGPFLPPRTTLALVLSHPPAPHLAPERSTDMTETQKQAAQALQQSLDRRDNGGR